MAEISREFSSKKRSGGMQNLLGEFKGLYETRLRRLDEAEHSGEDTTKTRVRIMQAYVNDLSEQNEVLVQTVEELEREANDRVNILESKLKQVSGSSKEYVNKARDLERELRALTIEKTRTETMLEVGYFIFSNKILLMLKLITDELFFIH